MQLKISTDYAARAIVYLVTENSIIPSIKISEETGMTSNYTLKIMGMLERGGIVKSYRGIEGGFRIAQEPNEITLGNIIRLMEPTIKLNRCLEEDKFCSRKQSDSCIVHKFYEELKSEIEALLDGINMQMIVNGEIGGIKVVKQHQERSGN